MSEIAAAYLSILPSTKGFSKKLEAGVSRDVSGSGKRLGAGFGKAFGLAGGVIAAAGIGGFLKDSIAEAREAQKVGALTESTIKSMGLTSVVTSKQIGALAGAISAKTGIDDEAVQSGENLLLTFGNVAQSAGQAGGVFEQTTKLAVDMSAALGQDMKSSSIQLGKALNDPIKGVSALSRVGVSFTEQQKKQIKTLVSSGKVAKAQGLILKEVGKQFGGAAEAMATPGEKAAVAIGNLKETIGTALLPVVDRTARFITSKVIPGLERFGALVQAKVVPQVKAFAASLRGPLLAVVGRVRSIFERLQPTLVRVGTFLRENPKTVKVFAVALGALAGVIGAITLATTLFSIALNSTGIPLVIIGIAALAAGLFYAYQKSETFRNIVNGVGTSLKNLAAFVRTNLVPVVVDLANTIAQKARPILEQLGVTFRTKIQPTLIAAVQKFREMQPALQRIAAAIGRVIVVGVRVEAAILKFYVTVASKVIPVLIRFAGFVFSKVVPAVVEFIGVVVKIIAKIISFGEEVLKAARRLGSFVTKVGEKIGDVITKVGELPGLAATALGDLKTTLVNAGKDLIQGLIDGVDSMFDPVRTKLGELTGKLGEWKGPPKRDKVLLRPAGRVIIAGLIKGFEDNIPKVRAVLSRLTETISGQISNAADAMRNLSSTVADAFRPDLFAGNLSDFFNKGFQAKLDLRKLKQSFLRLKKFGLGEGFLSDLFASGNAPLINQIAGGTKADARSAQYLFNQTNGLSKQLGNAVGRNQFGDDLASLRSELTQVVAELKKLPNATGKAVGKEINHAATRGRREARA